MKSLEFTYAMLSYPQVFCLMIALLQGSAQSNPNRKYCVSP